MKDLLIKFPSIYLLLFCLLALIAGIETGYGIKNGFPQNGDVFYATLFGIIINFLLSFYFLFAFIKMKNKKE